MVTITTIYYAQLEPERDPVTGKIKERKVSDLEGIGRKLVLVFQGTNRVLPDGNE